MKMVVLQEIQTICIIQSHEQLVTKCCNHKDRA